MYKAICGSVLKESTPIKQMWPSCSVDYENDATAFIKEAKKKEDEKMDDDEKLKNLVPVDSTG